MHARRFSLPLARPLGTARGEIAEREGFVVGVEPEADAVPSRGVGEATPLPGWTESLAACERALEAAAERASPDASPPDLDAERFSDAPAARHAVSLARLDADARAAGESLADRLAASQGLPAPTDAVPVNATVGDSDPATTAAAAREAVEAGFRTVKVKVGARDLGADLERLRAVRKTVDDAAETAGEAVPPRVALRADANGAWDRETAERALAATAAPEIDLASVEQPLPPEDLAGHAALREGFDVGVALDESLAAAGLDAVLSAGAADAVVLKPMALGGPDRALSAAVRARDAGVEPVVTTTVDAVVARTAAVHVAAAIPDVSACGLATADLLAEDLALDPAPAAGGAIGVPEDPGVAGEAFDDLVF
ncbi:mandelate racemase/muconate lactonizing enzyme family protein [Haloparvum sedimenti]|uniref:mandelate racemase/muconate lactonizing enzyme family protein n=1 Tax=Haloparvum sedimenti TaxID=1678448 RepID=UPI00071E905A|nr:enolase C-terminal domain-like protein [Haloparvum sedimenti]